MKSLADEFFGISTLTKSMKDAIDETVEANAAVDENQINGFWHFDGESFENGRNRLVQLKSQIISQLQASTDGSAARRSLGAALHTLQDFYSHSNWVELGNSTPNTNITKGGALSFASSSERTCKDNLIFSGTSGVLVTSRLTSGYYGGEIEVKPAPDPGKCNHGGILEGLFTDGINKDVSNATFAPHSFYHYSAGQLAQEASKQFIRDIKNTPGVTPAQMKRLFGIELTLSIAIDTTGSMGPIIESVKNQAIAIVDARIGTPLEPTKYVLAPFNDPSVPTAMVFDEPNGFKAAISSLSASGGGDCPELAVGGMLQALASSGRGGDLFMFTDASAKDTANVGSALALAEEKKITVHTSLFGSCSPVDPAYIRLTSATGGEFFMLSFAEAGNVAKLADLLVRPNKVNLLIVDDVLVGAEKTFSVAVDSTLTRVTFVVSGTSNVVIKRPDSSIVAPGGPGVTIVPLSSGQLVSVDAPTTGAWTITVNGSGVFALRASGESLLDLDSFLFLEPKGRPGHQGDFPISGRPISGRSYLASARLTGGSGSQFALRTGAGALIRTLTMVQGLGNANDSYFGQVAVPGTAFNVYASGTDPSGHPFQRVRAISVQPQPIQVVAPVPPGLRVGADSVLEFKVKNFGPAGTFQIRATDNRGYLKSFSPNIVPLATNEEAVVSVTLRPLNNAPTGDSTFLTVTAENLADRSIINGVSIPVIVEEGFDADREPPKLAIVATPSILWPVNHKMIPVSIEISVSDNRDPSPIVILDSITSNENQDALGDGHTSPDIQMDGSGKILLRAERSGPGSDRVYTITYSARDKSGNLSNASTRVRVPHDRGN